MIFMSGRSIEKTLLILLVAFNQNNCYAEERITEPYTIYGFGAAGESLSLGEWISNKNQYYQMAFDACLNEYASHGYPEVGQKSCTLNKVEGTYSYPNASIINEIESPQGIIYSRTKNNTYTSLEGYIAISFECPIDYSAKTISIGPNQSIRECVKTDYKTCESDGDPINIFSGEKFENVVDFSTADGLLQVKRNFVNQFKGWSINGLEKIHVYPFKDLVKIRREMYRYTFDDPIDFNKQEKFIYKSSANLKGNKKIYFELNEKIHAYNTEENRFSYLKKNHGNSVSYEIAKNGEKNWTYKNEKGEVLIFNQYGNIIKKINRIGQEINFEYSNNLLVKAQDSFGRTLNYSYDYHGRLEKVVLPDNRYIEYIYGDDPYSIEFELLKKVVWSNGESITYLYNESSHKDPASKSQFLLTGKLDSNNNRIDTTKYSSSKAIYNEIALGVHPRIFSGSSVRAVKDGLGSSRNYTYSNPLADGTRVLLNTNQPAGSGCAAATESATYYSDGLKKSETNFNGHKTQFTYDFNRGLETVRVEGIPKNNNVDYLPENKALIVGARKITTQWHSQLRKPVKKAEPKLITTFVYNGDNDPFNNNQIANCAPATIPLLCHKVQQATTDINGGAGIAATLDSTSTARHEFYTYNTYGQQLTFSRTETGAPDEIREYYDATTTDWTLGDLKRITNALGHVTQFTRYDRNGRLLEMLDANNVKTEFSYDARGRVLSQSVAGEITTHSYDLNGNRVGSVLPNGVTMTYHYDLAKRLTAVENSLGEKVNYEYDVESNLRFERITNVSNAVTYTKQHVYDALSRVQNTLNSNNQGSTYLYDAKGNLTGEVDAKNQSTNHTIDPLDRLTRTTDALSGKTDFAYDNQGNLTQVTDARNNVTSYVYNAFNDLTSQTSPDTGTTIFTYDSAGNRTGSTDARGVVITYEYDALNRLTNIIYPAAPSENVTYLYDSTTNGNYGIGRLTSIITSTTRLDFEYNHAGLITKKYAQAANTFVSTHYRYDAAGNLTGITYPSGREVNYQLDALARISSITTKLNASAPEQTLVNNIAYLPFGPANTYQYGNNLTHVQTYDQDYRLTGIQVDGILNRSYGYDLVNNITSINNALSSTHDQIYGYDALNRLITASGGYGNLIYDYDAVGNRLSETRNGSSDIYQYETTSNRLSGITRASGNRNFTYDSAGNPVQRTADDNSEQNFTFNNANRLSSVSVNGTQTATYTYNPLGQRVVKTLSNDNKEIYHYDESGQLIAVTDGTGATLREYIYWGNQQIALITNGNTYYIHNDHLNTPQVMTNQSQQVVWMGDYEPFGEVATNQNNSTEIFSRFPGQYLDSETGLYYNYFRDYDPSIGRYIESDPIGLSGGINTYAYVGGNPLIYSDFFGLQKGGARRGPRGEYYPGYHRPASPMTPSNFVSKLNDSMRRNERLKDAINDALEEMGEEMDAWAQPDPDAGEFFKCITAECSDSNDPNACPIPETRNEDDWLPSAPSHKSLPKNCVCVQWGVR